MIKFQAQQNILNEMANIISNSTDEIYDICFCEYTYESKYNTIKMHFGYEKDGKNFNADPASSSAWRNFELAEELRALMKEHTGGEWTSFTLTLDADGKATTKFNYPES